MKKEYFAAMNSYRGFRSYYRDSFSTERRYIIKGGPGCGKSTLMRRLADEAERRGLETELYYCSSDTNSLDGIVIKELGVAVFDGTAPHEEAASAPGWRDNLIDLGAFWNADMLRARQDDIIAASEAKAYSYRQAYAQLGMAGDASTLRRRMLTDCINAGALGKCAERIAERIARGDISREIPSSVQAVVGAFGMDGYVYLPTLEDDTPAVIGIRDIHGAATLLLEQVCCQLGRRGIPFIAGIDAPSGDICAVRASGTTVTLRADIAGTSGRRMIGCRALLNTDRESEQALKRLDSLILHLRSRAAQHLGEVKKEHFILEEIYGEAMDYSKVDNCCNELIEKLFPPKKKTGRKRASAKQTQPKSAGRENSGN